MSVAAVPAARLLLDASIGDIEELLVQSFTDDESAHDDEMQAQLAHDFASAFESAQGELSAKYGQPSRVGDEDDEVVPMTGVFRFAVWPTGDRLLFLAAAHEDRELPYLLVLGTAPLA